MSAWILKAEIPIRLHGSSDDREAVESFMESAVREAWFILS